MSTMNRKIAEIISEAGKKTAAYNTKHSIYYFFNEPKMPKCLIQKKK